MRVVADNTSKAMRLLLAALSLSLSVVAQADIYSFTDANGTVHFSDVPDDPRYRLYLRDPNKPALPHKLRSWIPANPRINRANKKRYTPYVNAAARATHMDAALLHAVISAESGYNPYAVSPRGAKGLMQLMPDTARRYGVTNLFDPSQNIVAGAKYLRDLMHMFNNHLKLALAAYNAGENAVIKYGNQVPPYTETMHYVPRVISFYRQYGGHP